MPLFNVPMTSHIQDAVPLCVCAVSNIWLALDPITLALFHVYVISAAVDTCIREQHHRYTIVTFTQDHTSFSLLVVLDLFARLLLQGNLPSH